MTDQTNPTRPFNDVSVSTIRVALIYSPYSIEYSYEPHFGPQNQSFVKMQAERKLEYDTKPLCRDFFFGKMDCKFLRIIQDEWMDQSEYRVRCYIRHFVFHAQSEIELTKEEWDSIKREVNSWERDRCLQIHTIEMHRVNMLPVYERLRMEETDQLPWKNPIRIGTFNIYL